jgi:hypothetical protein
LCGPGFVVVVFEQVGPVESESFEDVIGETSCVTLEDDGLFGAPGDRQARA